MKKIAKNCQRQYNHNKREKVKSMKFRILYYGNDSIAKMEGKALMKEITQENDLEKKLMFENFLRIPKNREWYEESLKEIEKNNSPLPYPSSIMMKINNSFSNIVVDLLPKLCYLGIYVNSKNLEKFIEDNFKDLI